MNKVKINTLNLSPTALNSVRLNCIGASEGRKKPDSPYVTFSDAECMRVMLSKLDADGDGKISKEEAAKSNIMMTSWFQRNTTITEASGGFKWLRSVWTLNALFYGCTNLVKADLSGMGVNSLFSNLNTLFWGCSNLASVDIRGIDTSNVTSMQEAFYDCKQLAEIKGIEQLNTIKCTNFSRMLAGTALTSLTIGKLSGNCFQAFYAIKVLVSLNIGDCSAVTTTTNMFNQLYSLKNLTIVATPSVAFGLPDSQLLTSQSVTNIIEALPNVEDSPTLTLHSNAIARYDAEYGEEACEDACLEIGWILAYA